MTSFARDNPKEIKPLLGRTPTSRTPVDIQSKFHVEESFRDYVRAHLGHQLGPFAPRIERISVHFEDVNGTRRGPDTLCRVIVSMSHGEPVVIEEVCGDAREAFDLAVHRVYRQVHRHIDRRAPVRDENQTIRHPPGYRLPFP